MSKRKEILETALNLTTGDRNKSYGDPLDNLTVLANLISAYLKIEITAVDAAIIMNLTKVSRVAVNKNHNDNYVDGAAYMAIAGECAARLATNNTVNPIDKQREAVTKDPSKVFDGIESLKSNKYNPWSSL